MAEYDSTKPGYVSLQRLVTGKDEEFCKHVAKISTNLYYDYLKTFWFSSPMVAVLGMELVTVE